MTVSVLAACSHQAMRGVSTRSPIKGEHANTHRANTGEHGASTVASTLNG